MRLTDEQIAVLNRQSLGELEAALLAEVEALRADIETAKDLERRYAWNERALVARAEAAEAERDQWMQSHASVCEAGMRQAESIGGLQARAEAAAEPVEPQSLSWCATCNCFRHVCDFDGFIGCAAADCPHNRRPCPSCTPPDPAP